MENKTDHTTEHQNKNNFNSNDRLKLIIVGVLVFVLFLLFFGAGVWVGQERAEYSLHWAQNYHRNFGGPMMGFMMNMPQGDYINGYGVYGQIIKIDGNTIIIKNQDNVEEPVTVLDTTTIRNNMTEIKLSDLKVQDNVVIIGDPNDNGEIEATFIRVLPPTDSSFYRVLKNRNI